MADPFARRGYSDVRVTIGGSCPGVPIEPRGVSFHSVSATGGARAITGRLAELRRRLGSRRTERLRFELLVLPDDRYRPPSWLLLPDPRTVEGLLSPEPLRADDVVLVSGWPHHVARVISRPPLREPPAEGWPSLHRAIVQLGPVSWETVLAHFAHCRRAADRRRSRAGHQRTKEQPAAQQS